MEDQYGRHIAAAGSYIYIYIYIYILYKAVQGN